MKQHDRIVSAYCLGYQSWTVVPHQMEEDFKEMRDMGFGAVNLSFSENELKYARRAFELQVRLAHAAGLKVNVIPSRLGGRFAGAPFMPSVWLAQNPQYALYSKPGALPVACVESPAFRAWVREFMETLLRDYELDGIIWDEPKSHGLISRHPDTIAKFGEHPTEENMIDSFVEFLEEISGFCRELRPGMRQTMFVQKNYNPYFTGKAARIESLDYFGYDGNMARQSVFQEEPRWHKYRLEEVWERTVAECAQTGKKSFALVENMLMPSAAVDEFEENFERYLSRYTPDHLAIYYYAHNNEDPERVHAAVKRLMKKYL